MFTDLKFVIRGFLRTPAFTATALVTLALCLGANLTIFAVIDSVLLRPLPFPEPSRLVVVFNTYPKAGVDRDGGSVTNYYERRGALTGFSTLALVRPGSVVTGRAGSTDRTEVLRVTPGFLATLGVSPSVGREFTDEEMAPETSGVVILTDGYWRQRLQADPDAVGQTVRIDGLDKTIVGVLPPGFHYLSSEARLLLPLASRVAQRGPAERHSGTSAEMIGRLAPGTTIAQAQAETDRHNALLERTNPEAAMIAEAGFRSVVAPLHADHVASIRPTLLLLQAGVLLLVLIGSVNLVNLLLIRAGGRAKEVAIRQSMGATGRQLARLVMLETVTLATVGGALGLVVAVIGVGALKTFGIGQLPLGAQVVLNARLVAAALFGSAALGAAIATPIAWFGGRGDLAPALRSESRGGTATRGAQRLRHGFIVAQVALAFVLLAGSALLGLSLQRAMAVSPGFRPGHLLTGHLSLPRVRYGSPQALVSFAGRLLDHARSLPGVTAVAAATNMPFSGRPIKSAFTVAGHVPKAGESVQGHYGYGVTGDYFGTLGIPLIEGRFLTATDTERDARVAVVDQDFARRYWPGQSALGRQLYDGSGPHTSAEAFTVVGVVGSVKHAAVTELAAQGAVYLPFSSRADADLFLLARTTQEPEVHAASLARAVRLIDPELPLDGVRSMDTRIADSLAARRSPALLIGIFAVVALLLAAIGTYGVLSYGVAQRRREIGVRLALGAAPGQIGRQFLGLGLRFLAAGTVLGVVGTVAAGRLMQGILFGVPVVHAATLGVTAAIIGIVSLVACIIPARRAARVDPATVLGSQ